MRGFLIKSTVLQLSLCFAEEVETQSGMFLSVGQATKPRILYWKPELPYIATLYNAFQENMVRPYK